MAGGRLGLGLSAVLPIFIVSLFLIPMGVTWSGTVPTSAGGQSKGVVNSMTGAPTQDPSTAVTDGSMPGRPSSSGPGNVSWTLCLVNGQLLAGNAVCPNGPYPAGVAWDSQNGYLYVANANSNNASVINGVTDAVVGSVPVGTGPRGVTYDSGNGYLYVTNSGSNNVSVINGATDAVIGSVPVGSDPSGVAYDSANGYLYVANSNCSSSPCGQGNVSVINGVTDTVVGSVPVGSGPWGVAYDGSNGYLYVTDFNPGSVSIIANGPTPSAAPSTFLGLPDDLGYILIVAIVATVVVVVAVLLMRKRKGTQPAQQPYPPQPQTW